MIFSYATARSFNTARKVNQGLNAKIPLIVYNGAFIIDNATHELMQANFFAENDAAEILRDLLGAGVNPIVYCLDDKERFVYNRDQINEDTWEFVNSRKGDSRDTPVEDNDALFRKGIFYFTCIDSETKLGSLNEKYREQFACVFSKDIYSGAQWLEIMPKSSGKGPCSPLAGKAAGL